MSVRQIPVTTDPITLASDKRQRTSLVVRNDGSDKVFIGLNPADLDTKGFALLSGDTIAFNVDPSSSEKRQRDDITKLKWFVRADTATARVHVIEAEE